MHLPKKVHKHPVAVQFAQESFGLVYSKTMHLITSSPHQLCRYRKTVGNTEQTNSRKMGCLALSLSAGSDCFLNLPSKQKSIWMQIRYRDQLCGGKFYNYIIIKRWCFAHFALFYILTRQPALVAPRTHSSNLQKVNFTAAAPQQQQPVLLFHRRNLLLLLAALCCCWDRPAAAVR